MAPEDLSAVEAAAQEMDRKDAEQEHRAANGKPEEERGKPSVLDLIHERREQLAAERTLDLLVPGHDGNLAVRYHAEPLEELTDEFRKAQRKRDTDPLAGTDILVRLCETILIRNEEGDLQPLAVYASAAGRIDEDLQEAEDNPIGFDIRLARLGLIPEHVESARQIVKAFFSPEDAQVLAPASHIQSLQLWLQGQAEEIDNSLLDF